MNPTICRAIDSRAVIEFSYGGGHRVVEPHAHGISTAGNEVLRGYQVSGYSSSGNSPSWRLFDVSKITGLTVTTRTFPTNRPGYNPDDDGMTQVHCHV